MEVSQSKTTVASARCTAELLTPRAVGILMGPGAAAAELEEAAQSLVKDYPTEEMRGLLQQMLTHLRRNSIDRANFVHSKMVSIVATKLRATEIGPEILEGEKSCEQITTKSRRGRPRKDGKRALNKIFKDAIEFLRANHENTDGRQQAIEHIYNASAKANKVDIETAKRDIREI